MKFQDDISNVNTHTRTSRNQYVPHFFKVGGIINSVILKRFSCSYQSVVSLYIGPLVYRLFHCLKIENVIWGIPLKILIIFDKLD